MKRFFLLIILFVCVSLVSAENYITPGKRCEICESEILFCDGTLFANSSSLFYDNGTLITDLINDFCRVGGNCSFEFLNVTITNVNFTNTSVLQLDSFSKGSVLFIGNDSIVVEDNNGLFYNDSINTLDVNGSVIANNFSGFFVGNNSIWSKTNGNIHQTNLSENVGIGTDTPSSALDVIGDIELNSNINLLGPISGALSVYKAGTGLVQIAMGNDAGTPTIFQLDAGAAPDHFGVIPGGGFDIHYFEDSISTINKEIRLYGYPNGAGGNDYASFQIIGANNDLEIVTNNALGDIILSPGANVGLGTDGPESKLDVNGSNTQAIRIRGADSTVEVGDIYVDSFGALVLTTRNGSDTFGYIDVQPSDGQAFGLMIRGNNIGGGGNQPYTNIYVNDSAVDYVNIGVNKAASAGGLSITDNDFVGVGTNEPGQEIEIWGVTPTLRFNDVGQMSFDINVNGNEIAIRDVDDTIDILSFNNGSTTTYNNRGIIRTDADVLSIGNDDNDFGGAEGQDGVAIIFDDESDSGAVDYRMILDGSNGQISLQSGEASTQTWSTANSFLNIGGLLFAGSLQQGLVVVDGKLIMYDNQEAALYSPKWYITSGSALADIPTNATSVGINIDPSSLSNSLSVAGVDNNGTSSFRIYEDTSTGAEYYNLATNVNGDLEFRNDAGILAMVLEDANANVGIKATPNYALTVGGAIELNGTEVLASGVPGVYKTATIGMNVNAGSGSLFDLIFNNRAGNIIFANPSNTADVWVGTVANAEIVIGSAGGTTATTIQTDLVNITQGNLSVLLGNVAIGKSGANSSLDVGGSFSVSSIMTVNSNYNLSDDDYYVRVNASGGNVTLVFPSASTSFGRQLHVKKILGNSSSYVLINGSGADTINGLSQVSIQFANNSFGFVSLGGNEWEVA
jgi:hypothetical protein